LLQRIGKRIVNTYELKKKGTRQSRVATSLGCSAKFWSLILLCELPPTMSLPYGERMWSADEEKTIQHLLGQKLGVEHLAVRQGAGNSVCLFYFVFFEPHKDASVIGGICGFLIFFPLLIFFSWQRNSFMWSPGRPSNWRMAYLVLTDGVHQSSK
jgi:hypothetical protein